jgi:arabinose-5-phosphate isomerase
MIIEKAKEVLRIEAEGILALVDQVGPEFQKAVDLIMACPGRVIITGIGKSGLIGQKIAATLNSTGTTSFFLHPVEAMHGDLGMVDPSDVVLAISYSGESSELSILLPSLKKRGTKIIAMTGNPRSSLAVDADAILSVTIPQEACPLGLAPTTSTTATLAMGDALAVALLVQRGFKDEDFALFHPGGALGKRLLLRVEDLMHSGGDIPMVGLQTPLKEALFEITSKKLGITGVAGAGGELAGVFTDGDLRRSIEEGFDVLNRPIRELMNLNPKRILRTNLAAKALQKMEQHSITSLFVFESEEAVKPVGIIHLHDLLKAGVV